MFYLVREVGKIWRCSCWEKGNFITINVFKYGETWTSVWPFPISLSLYSTFKHSLFPFCVRERNKLDNTIQDAESIKQFKLMIKTFFFLTNDSTNCQYNDNIWPNCLQGFSYNSVLIQTLVTTHFIIISKTVWVPSAIVVLKQKQQYCHFLQMKDKSSVMFIR